MHLLFKFAEVLHVFGQRLSGAVVVAFEVLRYRLDKLDVSADAQFGLQVIQVD